MNTPKDFAMRLCIKGQPGGPAKEQPGPALGSDIKGADEVVARGPFQHRGRAEKLVLGFEAP